MKDTLVQDTLVKDTLVKGALMKDTRTPLPSPKNK